MYFILIEVNMLFSSCLINLKHVAYVSNCVAICSLKLIVLKTIIPQYYFALINIAKHKRLSPHALRIEII